MKKFIALGLLALSVGLLFPSDSRGREAATATPQKQAAGTARQQQWLKATPAERSRLAERIGEDGARKLARERGYGLISDGTKKSLPQGPDQVYRASNGRVVVFEAKGGTSQLGQAYGHPQGSPEWAVESAKRVLRSPRATESEKRAAKAIIQAAAKGKLEVQVVRTSHVLGQPTQTVVQQVAKTSDTARRLATAVNHPPTRPAASAATKAAQTARPSARPSALPSARPSARSGATAQSGVATRSGVVAKTASRVAVPVAVVVDTGTRVHRGSQTEKQYASGRITQQQRERAHSRNAAGMVGGWAGAWAGAELGAGGGALAGTAVAPGPGTAVGGVAGGIVGGVTGYFCGEAAAASAAEWSVGKVHSAGSTLSSQTNAAVDSVRKTWKRAWVR